MTTADTNRENARHVDGTFGEQAHSTPEAGLHSLPDFRGSTARKLDTEIAALRSKLDEAMEERRDEHLVDITRAMPADVGRVIFRTDSDEDEGTDSMLMFEGAEGPEDGYDITLPQAHIEHLYAALLDFDTDNAGDWFEGDEDGYYWMNMDEATALDHIQRYRNEKAAAQQDGALSPLALQRGMDAWSERAIRVRAHAAGLRAVHFHVTEESAGVQVKWLEQSDGELIRPSDADNDWNFIVAQTQNFAHPSEGMRESGNPEYPLTLDV